MDAQGKECTGGETTTGALKSKETVNFLNSAFEYEHSHEGQDVRLQTHDGPSGRGANTMENMMFQYERNDSQPQMDQQVAGTPRHA